MLPTVGSGAVRRPVPKPARSKWVVRPYFVRASANCTATQWFLCLRLRRRLYNIPRIPIVESTKANQMIQVKQAFYAPLFIIAVVLLAVPARHAQTLPSETPQDF